MYVHRTQILIQVLIQIITQKLTWFIRLMRAAAAVSLKNLKPFNQILSLSSVFCPE